jgi:bifunctional DNA-binding transcriptional regulator/antitoxin component of YhaV-PrlF toxin-antitoxin module
MSEAVVKRIDPQGRISLPVDWRKEWKCKKVVLTRRGSKIEVAPIEPLNPSELFDSIEVPGDVDFSDPHALKKGLMELHGN